MHFTYWRMSEYFCTYEIFAVNAIMCAFMPCLAIFFIIELLYKNFKTMYNIMYVVLFVIFQLFEKGFDIAKTIADKWHIRKILLFVNNAYQYLTLYVEKYQSINYAIKIAAIYYNIYVLYYSVIFLHRLLFFNVHSKIIIKLFVVLGIDVVLYSLIIK
ncbi:hypothetical protein QKT50_gp114 [Rachiplusia ou multiple nucleopolyhedrovirus]|uniref:Uncharacterized protein n=1 Tax=Rachiplusia ou multiple nucleopolyhedrovirus (strain R1) TaxID=654904 RepID=Q8B9E3_NPVR1|nr:hypothetical protein QKT50_gp114 [Rachiplusia ou multiple nucleopolyhedrovirus]AAN28114.1 unknown [Rachiplusia ou multiple nucleopolyhedrovirus]